MQLPAAERFRIRSCSFSTVRSVARVIIYFWSLPSTGRPTIPIHRRTTIEFNRKILIVSSRRQPNYHQVSITVHLHHLFAA